MEVEPVDTALAYVWIISTILAILVIGLFFFIIPYLPSRRDHLHVFIASLLATRILFCGFVLITSASVTLKKQGWDVVPCQVTFWGWTTSWLTDCLTVLAALICGFMFLKTDKKRRIYSDVTVAAIWVVSTITASCLILVRDEIDEIKNAEKYDSHCWTLPYTHQQVFGLSFILVYLIVSIFITALVSVLGICILPVYKRLESVSPADGPQLTRYHNNVQNYSNGKKQEAFNGHLSNGDFHEATVAKGITQNAVKTSKSDTGSNPSYTVAVRPKRPNGVEPLHFDDFDDLDTSRSTNPGSEQGVSMIEMDKLDRVNILCTISSLTVFLNLIPQTIVLGISLLRESPVAHGEDILLACGVLHSLLLPAGLSVASRPYRKALIQLLTPSTDHKISNDMADCNITAADQNQTRISVPSSISDDYVTIENIPKIHIISATPQIAHRSNHSATSKRTSSPASRRRPNRSASSIWSRDEDKRRRRAMASIKRTQSNQTMREWVQNLRNSIIEGDKVDDDLRNKSSASNKKKITRCQSTKSESSDHGDVSYNDSDINDALDTLDTLAEEDEPVINNVLQDEDKADVSLQTNSDNTSHTETQNIYDEVTSTSGRTPTPKFDDAEYCRLEDIEVMVQTKTPFHVSQKYTLSENDSRSERLRYIIQGLEEAGVPFIIDHTGLVHVFDTPDSLPRSLDTTLDTINHSNSPVEFNATETPQDEALYIDIYARATNPFNKEWQPVYADSPSLTKAEAEIIAISYKGRRPSRQEPLVTPKKKSNNPFLTTSFLKKFMTRRGKNSLENARSHANIAYVPTEHDSPISRVWDNGVQPETTHQLQYHTLGYQGAYVTSNNPFMTSSPIESSRSATNPFYLPSNSNSSFTDESMSSQRTNPFNTSMPPGFYTPPGGYNQSNGSVGRTSGERRRKSLLPFSITDFLRSKSENLAVYDNGQVAHYPSNNGNHDDTFYETSPDYYNYNRAPPNDSNPFVIKFHDHPQNELYTTDYV